MAPINIKHPSKKYNPKSSNAIRLEVPCGKCVECLQDRREMWSLRIAEEWKDHTDSAFITLTYDNENITYGEHLPTLVKSDLQNWFKRLRDRIKPIKVRYYAVGEYGTKTLRPHYHVILFGLPLKLIKDGILEQTWKHGHVHYGTLTRASIHYATKYHVNRYNDVEGSEPSFTLMSRNPGIGARYLKKMEKIHDGNLERAYYQDGNYKKRLPRYYRDKLYTEDEREHINNMSKRVSIYDEETIKKHYKDNDINYFEYQQQKKLEKIRQFQSKINENNKF